MKVTLLGTGADHCIPAFRCLCPVCQDARKRGITRQNSCAVIERDDGNLILIDMPPQIMLMFGNYHIPDEKIYDVLITHRHADHTLGLRYLFHGKHEKGFSVKEPVNLHIPKQAFESISKKIHSDKKDLQLHPTETDFYKIHFIETYKSFTIRDTKVTPIETGHLLAKIARDANLDKPLKSSEQSGEATLGFIFENADGKTFAYLLDASMKLPQRTVEILEKKKIDSLILECTYSHESWFTGHFDIDGVVEFKEKFKPDWMSVSHVSHKNLKTSDLADKLAKNGIKPSFDGMSFTV